MRSSKWLVEITKHVLWFLVSAGCIVHMTSAASCRTVFVFNGANKTYSQCSDMITNRNKVSIAWSYQPQNLSLDVAFSGELQTYGGWIGWGINPNCSVMPETNALVAYRAFNGSTILPYKLGHSQYKREEVGSPPKLRCSPIDIEILYRAVDIVDASVTMYITVRLQPNQTTVNQVWGQGLYVRDFIPSAPCNFTSHNVATLDVFNGVTNFGVRQKCRVSNFRLKNIHGILAGVGYGLLYPIATILSICLYFNKKKGHYYYYGLLATAYLVGTFGFNIGLLLHARHVPRDDDSPGALRQHRNLGIAIVALSSFQVLISICRLLARKRVTGNHNGEGGKVLYMIVNVVVGYALTILTVVNIFLGIDLFETTKGWRVAYIVIAIVSCMLVGGGGESG